MIDLITIVFVVAWLGLVIVDVILRNLLRAFFELFVVAMVLFAAATEPSAPQGAIAIHDASPLCVAVGGKSQPLLNGRGADDLQQRGSGTPISINYARGGKP